MATKKKDRVLNQIINAIEQNSKPTQFMDIVIAMRIVDDFSKKSSTRVILSNAIKLGIIKKVKFPKRNCYYCKPDWLEEDGSLKKKYHFNPYWKN